MDGVLLRMLIPSEALTASNGGMEAEKTKEDPLMRYGSEGEGRYIVTVEWEDIPGGR